VEEELALHDESAADEDNEGLIRLYADTSLDAPTDRAPLPAPDRARVRELGEIALALREHPFLPKAWKPHDALTEAMAKLGWEAPARGGPEDLTPYDVLERLRRVEIRLHRLALKHFALRRVREFCALLRRKWALAGPLADLDASAMRQALAALVDRHLVLREADGAVGVHPAVRDHFARLGDEPSRGGWHDLIREQLVSLAGRPGRALPEDKATLDLIEEAIHHALAAGRGEEAWKLYDRGLGGVRHLGWKLGEMARGLRILRGFEECPDRSALGWFLRALGELDEAYLANPMPFFRADLRLLQGRLPEVAAEGVSVRAAIASFLMGDQGAAVPPDTLGPAIPRIQLLLLAGRLRVAGIDPRPDRLYGTIGWEGDRTRCLLLMAELARRQSDAEGCLRTLETATGWVLHSGSVEHLCLWHLVRSRAERDRGDFPAARRAADEGVHLARQSGLGLYHVLLLNARAEILLQADPEAAEQSARAAFELASAADCRFGWGQSEAGHLLGQALALQWRHREARAVYTETVALRRRLGDPGLEQTRRLLERLPS
jgi:hypothetical protein